MLSVDVGMDSRRLSLTSRDWMGSVRSTTQRLSVQLRDLQIEVAPADSSLVMFGVGENMK